MATLTTTISGDRIHREYDELRGSQASGKQRLVIVGAGFAGMYTALGLAREDIDITVIDKKNHHLFQPLLYQVATAALSAPDIAAPIRKILERQSNARVLLEEVVSIDTAGHRLELSQGTLSYDWLVLAPGARDSYFGHDEWAAFAPGLKTIEDAFTIRGRILTAFERAEREVDPAQRAIDLTFVVVGGGPTGVELAGSIAEIARKTLTRNFRSFDPSSARVILVEGGDRLLPSYPPELSQKALEQLERIGAEVRLNSRVSDIAGRGVRIGETWLEARTVLWAAGVRASGLLATLGTPLDRQGRAIVELDLSIPGHPEVLVLGDAAAVKYQDGFVPGVAPAAIQMGQYAARVVRARRHGDAIVPFSYRDKGSLATIGRRAAVADLGRFRFSGAIAWLLWLFIHIFFLIGFRNRVAVMFEWGIAYLTYQRSARVILTRSDVKE